MNGASKRRPPRLNHKKSKVGCLRCKQRRVKCDEKHPKCGGCERHEVECIWSAVSGAIDHVTASVTEKQQQQQQSPILPAPSRSWTSILPKSISDDIDKDETRSRRLLEINLTHNFISNTITSLPGADAPAVLDTWLRKAVPLALTHPSLMHALMAVSSFHLAFLQPNAVRAHVTTGHLYMSRAMRMHNEDVANLTPETADAVALTCVLMSVLTFRNIGAYALEQAGEDESTQREFASPVASLHQRMVLINGTHETIGKVWDWQKNNSDSVLIVMMANMPVLWDQRAGAARGGGLYVMVQEPRLPDSLEEGLGHLLNKAPRIGPALYRPNEEPPPAPMIEELEDEGTVALYQSAIQHIKSLYRSIASGDYEPQSMSQLVCAASSLVPLTFLELTREGRPRAKILMLFCFVAFHECRDIWWIGDRATRDAVQLAMELGCGWRPYMEWPLRYVGKWEDMLVGNEPESEVWCRI